MPVIVKTLFENGTCDLVSTTNSNVYIYMIGFRYFKLLKF